MNTERHEELAALAALDLLTPAEQAELTAALALDPALQTLIDSLREAAAHLAHTAPAATPPAALKARLLANVAVLPAAKVEGKTKTDSAAPATAEILEFKIPAPAKRHSRLPAFTGWLAAACLALTSAWLGQGFLTAQKANQALRDQQLLADLTLRSTQNQLEAERLLAKRELADATAKAAESTLTLAALQARVDAINSASSDLTARLALAQTELDRTRAQLADTRSALTSRDTRLAELSDRLKSQGDLANYKIATLASLAGNTPAALGVAVWNPANQQGVLTVQKLPALASDKDYQLWVFDDQNPAPISGGTFTVDPATGEARVNFRPTQSVKAAQKFAISLEPKGGGPAPRGPVLFLGQ